MSAIKNISLYIPHVFPNFDKAYVEDAFKSIGEVSRVDFVAKQDRNGNNFNAVYVHFNKWHNTKRAAAFYDSVVDETKEARLIHDNPWYWLVLPNNAKRHISGERKPRLDLGEAKAISASNIAPTLQTTPVKASSAAKVCPGAPAKRSYAQAILKQNNLQSKIQSFKDAFDADNEMDDDEMAEIAELIESEYKNLEIIDGRAFFKQNERQSLKTSFDEVAAFEAEIHAEMDEIEELCKSEDENLITIDGRYVQTIEQENLGLNQEIGQLRAALINLDLMYQAEVAKVRAFSNVEL